MQELDHALELVLDRVRAGGLGGLGGVAGVRGEEGGRVVAPVVRQPELLQVRLVHVEMDGQELDRRDAQRDQVLDHGRVGHPGVGPLQFLRNIRVQLGLAPDVGLVDDRVAPRHAGAAVQPPVKVVADPDAGDQPFPFVHGPAVRVHQQRLLADGVKIRGGHGQREGLVFRRRPEAVARTGRNALHDAVVDAVGEVGQGLDLPGSPGRLKCDLKGGHAGRVHSHVGERTPGIVHGRRPGMRNADAQRKRSRSVYGGSCIYKGHNHCLKLSRAGQMAPVFVFMTFCSVRNSRLHTGMKRRVGGN